MNIRKVIAGDASAVACIYNYYVENTDITFEEESVSEVAMAL
jgi:L-amino acid N-acyltransferase YncA